MLGPGLKTVLHRTSEGQKFTGTHHQTFSMRREQVEAVDKTSNIFSPSGRGWEKVPRFLWNGQDAFGKTFTTYRLEEAGRKAGAPCLTFQACRGGRVADGP